MINSQHLGILSKMGWRIVDGTNINVWSQHWIQNDSSGPISTAPLEAVKDLVVSDLMIQGTRQWNKHLIYALLPQRYDTILQLPLFDEFEEDRRIWKYTNDGIYFVKSVYRSIMEQARNHQQFQIEGDWMNIWSLNVPHKVRVFLWRVCRDCIPTKIQLESRDIDCSSIRLFCQQDLENSFHCFFKCPGSISVWEKEGLWCKIEPHLTCRISL